MMMVVDDDAVANDVDVVVDQNNIIVFVFTNCVDWEGLVE